MRIATNKDIIAMVGKGDVGYKLFRKVNGKLVSANKFHGNVLEYEVGKITDDNGGEGIFVYLDPVIAKSFAPTTADAVVLAKVVGIGLLEKKEKWNTYKSAYVAEILETLSTGIELGVVYFAPKKKEFFKVLKIVGGTYVCTPFSDSYEEAQAEGQTMVLKHIANCQKVVLPNINGVFFVREDGEWVAVEQ